jgi:multicomponent Na+:H+ antiporter subunit G
VSWLEIATLATLFSGVAFYAAGSLGLLRFPDPHARLHALTKADNVGLGLVALAAALHWGTPEQAAKIALVWLFAILAAGTTAQLMADAARRDERDAGGRSEAGPE